MQDAYRIEQRKKGHVTWRRHAFSLGATLEQCERYVKERSRDGYDLRIVSTVARRNGGH